MKMNLKLVLRLKCKRVAFSVVSHDTPKHEKLLVENLNRVSTNSPNGSFGKFFDLKKGAKGKRREGAVKGGTAWKTRVKRMPIDNTQH
jgi:hypothetical protein